MKPEQETNFYSPNGDENVAAATEQPQPAAKDSAAIAWTAAEYIEHQRGASWYLVLFVATAGVAGGTYFLTKDYFAAGIIVALGIIVAIFVGHKPSELEFELSSTGFRAGQKTYSYNSFKSFSVFHEGAQTSLNFTPVKRFMPPVSAYFDPKNEEKITNFVGERLPYEERNPSAVDRLGARLRL